MSGPAREADANVQAPGGEGPGTFTPGAEARARRRLRRGAAICAVADCVLIAATLPLWRRGAFPGLIVAGLAFLLVHWIPVLEVVRARLYRRRRRLWKEPPEPGALEFLARSVPLYGALPLPERERFAQAFKMTLAEVPWHGLEEASGWPEGTADKVRWFAAAAGVMAFFGRPEWEWNRLGLSEVIFVPEVLSGAREDEADGVVTEFDESGFLGLEGMFNGVITLVVPDVLEDMENPGDGINVALHEFAHLYEANGFAEGRDPAAWAECVKHEYRRIKRGDGLLDDYALTDGHELFALASEIFFMNPPRLRRYHPLLYRQLVDAYGQDPAGYWPATATPGGKRHGRRPRWRRGGSGAGHSPPGWG